MEQQKEGIRQEFMLLNWYLKEHLASAVRIAAFIGVFSLLCFLRNVPQDVTVYMIVLMAAAGACSSRGEEKRAAPVRPECRFHCP